MISGVTLVLSENSPVYIYYIILYELTISNQILCFNIPYFFYPIKILINLTVDIMHLGQFCIQ